MTYFFKPSPNPDSVGGVFPDRFPAVKCRNRTGTTLSRGDVVQLALTPGIATEAASNDSNTYVPSGSNDTVWNTVVLPVASTLSVPQSGTLTGGIFGVVSSTSVLDNGIVDVVFGGVVDAFVIDGGSVKDGAIPGQPLTVTAAKNFDADLTNGEIQVAFFLSPTDTTLTNRELKKVWLTQGIGMARHQSSTGIT